MTDQERIQTDAIIVETNELESEYLNRTVRVDIYSNNDGADPELLLVNDGQDLVKMEFGKMLDSFFAAKLLKPLVVIGIHCGEDRVNEYGMAAGPDYRGRGALGKPYQQFILNELLPVIAQRFPEFSFRKKSFAGFSLGALSALDMVWNHPDIFSKAAVFSGSLWWRSLSQDDKNYDQAVHRMMHSQVRNSAFRPGLKFFFECGEMDEVLDRNKNGVIDSIDDTIDLMRELIRKGYREGTDIYYLQIPDGKHDVASWGRAMQVFLTWGFGNN